MSKTMIISKDKISPPSTKTELPTQRHIIGNILQKGSKVKKLKVNKPAKSGVAIAKSQAVL